MKPLENNWVAGMRSHIGYSQKDMADFLGMPTSTYSRKEGNPEQFSDDAKVAMTKLFGWSFDKMNRVFYGGKLPSNSGDVPLEG